MRRCEYMIGDWVTCPQETWQWKATDYMLDDSTMCNVNPIPLTDEVLKANGWQLLSNYGREAYYAPNGVFSLDFRNGLFRLIIHGNIVIIEHVHQLQRALRLCGLNDLADNFRIGDKE